MTRRIRPGDRTLSADHLNKQAGLTQDVLGGRTASGTARLGISQESSSHYQNSDPDVINIRNDTGCTLSKFQVVGIDRIIDSSDETVFSAGVPNACRHTGQFAVALSEIAPDSEGQAVFSGYSVSSIPENASSGIDLYDGNPGYAAGDASLNAVSGGSGQVLWGVPQAGESGAWIGGVRLRNASFGLVGGSRDACGCAVDGCEYECQQDGSDYSWIVTHRGCKERTDSVRNSQNSQFCDCPDSSAISTVRHPCSAATAGRKVTMSCVNSGVTTTVVSLDVEDDLDCGSTCLWKRPETTGSDWVMIEGCQSDCDSKCRCVHPSMANVGLAAEVRMPCVSVSNDGTCVHRSLGNKWQLVYDGCDRACPCPEPEDDASIYQAGYELVTNCSDTRCAPCYPKGYCRWRHTISQTLNGFFIVQRSNWELLSSQCGPYCECRPEPPHSNTPTFSSYLAPYDDGEIVEVGCCRSPLGSCDPTSTTTTSTTTIPPTSTTSTTTGDPSTTTTTSTSTTSSPTTGCPTIGPLTTAAIEGSKSILTPVGTVYEPTCHYLCYRQCPVYDTRGDNSLPFSCVVHQESYGTINLGYPRNTLGEMCSNANMPRRGIDFFCELSQPCNASTVGTVIPGICKEATSRADADTPPWPDESGTASRC